MNTKNINFDNKKIKKVIFTKTEKCFNKILVSKKEPYGTKNALKYFIRYNDDVVKPLFVRL